MRYRDQFTDEFFGASGTMTKEIQPTETTSRETTTQATLVQHSAPNPAVIEEVDKDTQIKEEEPTYTLNQIQEISNLTNQIRPPMVYVEDDDTPPVVVVSDDVIDSIGYPISTGGGGGGAGGGVEEPEMKSVEPEDNKSNILWLILLAVGLYLGYRYFVKK